MEQVSKELNRGSNIAAQVNKKIKKNTSVVSVSSNWGKFISQQSTLPKRIQKQSTRKDSTHSQDNITLDVNKPVQNSHTGPTPHIAIDCEMVQCQDKMKNSVQVLARLSIINYNGHILLDQYYKPQLRITNYLTSVSGITPKHIYDAPVYGVEEQKRIQLILKGKVIVGHSLNNDFKALLMEDVKLQLRDISRVSSMRINGGPQSLKKLCQQYLGQSIQDGSHSSVVDARATMYIYRKMKHMIDEENKFANNYNLAKQEMLKDIGC